MFLLDTNIFVYLGNGTIQRSLVQDIDIAFASITKIEALGYNEITAAEQDYLAQLFNECQQYDLSETIIELAIKLRLRKKISLGDAIIAATALEHGLELWTANTKDFAGIEGLKLHNPSQKGAKT